MYRWWGIWSTSTMLPQQSPCVSRQFPSIARKGMMTEERGREKKTFTYGCYEDQGGKYITGIEWDEKVGVSKSLL